MAGCKVALVYFSGTQVTHAYAVVMRRAFAEQGCEARLVDVTSYASRREPLPIEECDGLVFGFPVYGDFAPSVINAWLPTLAGRGKRCAQFFTYGARAVGHAHYHTKVLLERAGFQVLLSAEFLGRHSYNVAGWRILPHRPDERDFAVARDYAALAVERFTQDAPPVFHLEAPPGYDRAVAALSSRQGRTERLWTHPRRVTASCSMGRECEAGCPAQAMDAETGLADPARCITCFHCVTICPDKVLQLDERMVGVYPEFLARNHLTDEIMDAKRSVVIA
jgi:ferredoxin